MRAQMTETVVKVTEVASAFKGKLDEYLSQFPDVVMIMHIDFGIAVISNTVGSLTMYTSTELWRYKSHVRKAPSIVLDGIQEIIFWELFMDAHTLFAFVKSNLRKKCTIHTQKNRRVISERAFRAREEYAESARIAASA